ncbi:undecaprenyl-diphosphatase [Ralstonia flaminis]|jgi:undecaprenyl-diphosphatase|uniref:Undecaprenyl-diphosphatase YbjG n=1 Tax=Ralstonia flaminis TaxID=3058597 RepID=A0ABN9JIZ7_9RALS|nr:undecaprenyl-diphosphatase [Ralstonia sp. LMG 18101]CAJ0813714.1 Putative undecaprenyl-diphosphatase YbjG [Ralstonia sp. LMG 18101]
MESLNHTLFLWLNAPTDPAPTTFWLAMSFAEYLIWLAPLTLVACWLWGEPTSRRRALQTALATALALLISAGFSLVWYHPRPFEIGLGTNLLPHAADSSFPSDHLTVWWTVAFSLMWDARLRRVGVWLALLGLPMAWARIYLGVHYPFDMLGAAGVATLSAWLGSGRVAHTLSEPLHRLGLAVHGVVLAPCVRRGWVRK